MSAVQQTLRPAAAWRWAAWGALLGALLALLLFAPARWLAAAVARASAGQVLLAEARGTVWQGDAVLVLTAGRGGREAWALPGRLSWRLRPAWTDAGLALQLRQDCCLPAGLTLQLQPGWGRLRATLSPAQAQLPAAWLVGLGTPWNTLQPGGILRLQSQPLVLEWAQGRWSLDGRAELEARDFSSRLSTLPRLGSYRLSLQARAGNPPQVQLQTLDGALRLQAEGSWSASGLRLRGEASAAPEDQAALDNLLNIIGRRDGARSVLSIG